MDQAPRKPLAQSNPRQANARKNSFSPRKKTEEGQEEFLEKVISIKRVSKVVKGGKNFSFNALVVAGDKKGHMGYGFGKGTEVSTAIKKALTHAKKNFVTVPLKGNTIPHEIIGYYDASVVMLRPAGDGTGVTGCARGGCCGGGREADH